MHFTFGKKLLLAFITYGTLLTGVSIFTIYTINSNNIHINSIKKSQTKAFEKINNFHTYYENVYDKLNAIKQSKTFKRYLKTKQNYGTTRELFLNIAYTSKNIMQLRYINNEGKEIIRINRKSINTKPQFVVASELQNKSHRYYFKEIMNIPKNKTWNSQIDLNVENDTIQKPFQSVLRVATPIFNGNKREGFLIINIFMNTFLEEFIKSPTYNIYMIDKNGYFKAHLDKTKTWTNYKSSSYTIKNRFANEYKQILSQEEYLGETLYSKYIDPSSLNNTIIVVEEKVHTLKKEIDKQVEELVLVMLGIILLSFPFAYIFATTPGKLKEQVDKLNQNLENKIDEKTFELQELNENLERKIKKEVEENSKKDTIIFHQSKIASMGDMLRNISHQWRQPLSAISTAASGIKFQKEMNLLKEKDIDDSIDAIMRNTTYLSKTIDDFRNFFKNDKKITKINLAQAIKNDLNILSPTLQNNHIDVVINLDESIEISTIKNELTQVYLNLVSNAKDMLIDKKNASLKERLISVELKKENEYALIRFIDNAGGIQNDIIEHIFDPYFTTKHQTQGTGIGLFMCEEIIRNHLNGSIKVLNQEFTYKDKSYKGAIFEIRLPLKS